MQADAGAKNSTFRLLQIAKEALAILRTLTNVIIIPNNHKRGMIITRIALLLPILSCIYGVGKEEIEREERERKKEIGSRGPPVLGPHEVPIGLLSSQQVVRFFLSYLLFVVCFRPFSSSLFSPPSSPSSLPLHLFIFCSVVCFTP